MSARLTVYANSNKPVPAKYLEINGEVIRGPSGDPYIVPADFDWNTYMGKFERLKHSLETAENVDRSHPDEIVRAGGYASMVYTFLYDQFHAAWPARPSDVQRTYNGYAGKGEGDFVAAFTPAASFLYGAACAALGLSEEECLAGGGAQNILSARAARRKGQAGAIDTSGKYYNAPINVPHIENGWNAYTNGVSASGGASRKADTSPGHSGKPARAPVNKAPVPASPTQRSPFREVPQPPSRFASLPMGSLGPVEQVGRKNRFPSLDTSQGLPAPFSDPLAHYVNTGFSPPMENPSVPWLDAIVQPNPFAAPSSFESLFSGSGNQPEAGPQPPGRPKAKPERPAGQARKAPFYSLKDRLDFLGRVYRVAKPISETTGLSLPFILAHAAHEVDFGKNIEGNNLFNLKADERWRGPTYTRASETYRSYPSYQESMNDYLAYLQGNPRFGTMFEPVTRASLGRLADAIHYASYSDDPLLWFPRFPFVEGVAPPALPVEGATLAPLIVSSPRQRTP
jgi:hypothetical protein